ncbi:YegP family protein [Halodesulfurarchaeum sp.]|uniref:YegP family protein n=1 Tax=Halodesulfurarchaeum sp. TaxID=1980530 RepID=UPI001BBE9C1C|nr:DUF1508 domain-containing protein [Halodesulfurarchaeum sp.]
MISCPKPINIEIGQPVFEVYDDEVGDQRWRLRHSNGTTLPTGAQGYSNRNGVWTGIQSVKRNASNTLKVIFVSNTSPGKSN